MINKFYKIIHNKYSRFIKFIFFLRYLIVIFIISITLFLIIPFFFNYEERSNTIKNHLLKNYNFEIENFDKINFQAFPLPRLELKNVSIKFASSSLKLNVKNLKIYPKLISIYNYKKYQSKKIILKDNNIVLRVSDLKSLTDSLFYKENKFFFDNLNIKITDENQPIIRIENIKFTNFGYNKNLITGKVFGKKFKTKINNNFRNINFKLVDSGISADIDFDENQNKNSKNGIFKSKILNTSLKLNFSYNDKKLKLYNSYFRNKNLSFKNSNELVLEPFLDLRSKFQIEEFNTKILKKINLDKILASKSIIKKINSKNEINFKSRKFSRNLIDKLNLNVDLAYGRINYLKRFTISENFFQCKGNVNLLEDYPLLYFNCSIILENKKKFLKELSIKINSDDASLKLNFKGSIGLLNKKINFKEITLKENNEVSKEDLKYFKDVFEKLLYDESFFEIFNAKKIEKFIIEIS